MSRARIVRMEKVRDFRKEELDRASVALSTARKEEAEAKGRLDDAIARESDAAAKRAASIGGASSVADWTLLEQWLLSAQAAVGRARLAHQGQVRKTVGAQEQALRARTHVERIESLIERYRTEDAKLATTAERKLEDEISGRRHALR